MVCFDLDVPDEYDLDERGTYYLFEANMRIGHDVQLHIKSSALERSAEAGCPSCGLLKEIRDRLQSYSLSRWPTIDRTPRGLEARDSIRWVSALKGPASLPCGWLRKLRGQLSKRCSRGRWPKDDASLNGLATWQRFRNTDSGFWVTAREDRFSHAKVITLYQSFNQYYTRERGICLYRELRKPGSAVLFASITLFTIRSVRRFSATYQQLQ